MLQAAEVGNRLTKPEYREVVPDCAWAWSTPSTT